MPVLSPEERLGSVLADKYRLERILGRGGMGVVFAGTHEITHRPVAIKLMLPSYSDDASTVRRFYQEARAAATLHHPNVVDVLDMGEAADGQLFLALEFLEGESLAERIESGPPLTPEEALEALVPIVDALAMMHDKGSIHRDIKPDNIFLSLDGRGSMIPKLLDFGIAKVAADSSLKTKTGTLMGTPMYMSPEQASSAPDVGPGADVWAFGAVLHECLAGAPPYAASSVPALLLQIVTMDAPPIRDLRPDCPEDLAHVVGRALTRDRAERYADAGELLEALHGVSGVSAPATSSVRPSKRRSGEQTAVAGGFDVRATAPSTPGVELPTAEVSEAAANGAPDAGSTAAVPGLVATVALSTPVSPDDNQPVEASASASRWPLAAVAIGLLAALGGVGLYALGGGDDSSASRPAPLEPTGAEAAGAATEPTASSHVTAEDAGVGAQDVGAQDVGAQDVEAQGVEVPNLAPDALVEPLTEVSAPIAPTEAADAPSSPRRRHRRRASPPPEERTGLGQIPVDPGF